MTNLKQIPIAPDYYINKEGLVYSTKHGKFKLLKVYSEETGYKVVSLCQEGKYIRKRIHQLVAITFIPNPNNYKCINHIDADKTNNYVDNLEWCTQLHNIRHSFALGLVPRKKGAEFWAYDKGRKVLHKDTGIIYNSVAGAARATGIPRTTISAEILGRKKNKHNFIYA